VRHDVSSEGRGATRLRRIRRARADIWVPRAGLDERAPSHDAPRLTKPPESKAARRANDASALPAS